MAWLAHYGVPKSQWSDEARRRYDAQHRGKNDLPWPMIIGGGKRAYDEYQEQNHNRGGNRSNNIHNKVDESRVNSRRSRDNGDSARFDRAQSSRRHTNGTGVRKPSSNGRTPLRDTSIRSKNPGTEEVRRRDLNETQRSLRNGKNASRRSKNTTTTQAADAAIARNMRSGSSGGSLRNRYDSVKPRKRRNPFTVDLESNNAMGRGAARFQNDIRSHGGGFTNYTHNGQHVHQGPQGTGISDVIANKNTSRRRKKK